MTPAIVRWGSSAAWFSDARDADALASVLRRGTDTVTVEAVKWGPDEVDDAIERRDELEEAVDDALAALEPTIGEGGPSRLCGAIQAALEALRETRP